MAARVLLLSGSAGHGHVKAAQALLEAFRARHPQLVVEHWDALDHMPAWFRGTYRRGYVALVDRFPGLWRRLYEATDRRHSRLGHLLTRLAGRRLVRDVLAWAPDLVLCTHFLAPELLSGARGDGRLAAPLEVVVTDHDAHRAWHWPHVSRAFVSSEPVAERFAQRYGLPRAALVVTGIPVRAGFGAPCDVAAVRERLGLVAGRPTVLFLSGGFAAAPVAPAIAALWRERPDVQVLAVCGTNVRQRRAVEALERPPGSVLHALGFVDEVPALMAVADVVVSKSGGITTSECMAAGRPLLVAAHIAGQEERNADAVVAAGAGVRGLGPEGLLASLRGRLGDPQALAAMPAAARGFGRPLAAEAVAADVAARGA
ncbi:MAG: MGDG synthase family glycosyltransferase, partial [Planctomycetia bacterium]